MNVAVLFDLDGVIVDSREHHLTAWHQLAREHDLAYADGYFTRTFGLRNDAIIGELVPGIAPGELHGLAARKEQLFRDAARGHLKPLSGVLDLLAFLDAGAIPRAIVTSAPRDNLTLILETLGMSSRFDALVAEEDAARGKPDPQGFLVAASRVAVEPARCIVIEDAPAGLHAAKAGGMRAIGVTTTHPAARLTAANLVVATLDDPSVRPFILPAQIDDRSTATPRL